jgi:MarR family transcriptional regulator, organic hydroperoxide resistance regulator
VERKVHGKTVLVYPTAKGQELEGTIRGMSKNLHLRYEAILGKEVTEKLNKEIHLTSEQLNKE